MSAFGWILTLLPWRQGQAGPAHELPAPSSDSPANGRVLDDPLERARALAREGRKREASEIYWKIKRKQRTVEGLVEHAELLLELGNLFDAASMAANARELDPENERAKAVQIRVRTIESG